MPKRSAIAAIAEARCPQCRQGKMFKHPFWSLTRFDKMYEHCPVCGLKYEVELGFYWGAMYISYGFSVVLVLITGISLYYLANDPPTWVYLAVVTACILVLTPLLFRYARVLMLHFFGSVKYKPELNR